MPWSGGLCRTRNRGPAPERPRPVEVVRRPSQVRESAVATWPFVGDWLQEEARGVLCPFRIVWQSDWISNPSAVSF